MTKLSLETLESRLCLDALPVGANNTILVSDGGEPLNPSLTTLSGLTQDQIQQAVLGAEQGWEAVSSLSFENVATMPAGAGLPIGNLGNPPASAPVIRLGVGSEITSNGFGTDILGWTSQSTSGGALPLDGSPLPIDNASVVINSAVSWTETLLQQVLGHELGHALGLAHSPSSGPASIMKSEITLDSTSPTTADGQALAALGYSIPNNILTTTTLASANLGVAPSVNLGIGVFDSTTATWYLRKDTSPGAPSIQPFQYGEPGWIPVVGDWKGDGHTGIGVFDPTTATWYLRYEDGPGAPDIGVYHYGEPGWTPVVGDWDGSGYSKIGVFKDGEWVLAVPGGVSIKSFGGVGNTPMVGNWDHTNLTELGVQYNNYLYENTLEGLVVIPQPNTQITLADHIFEVDLAVDAWIVDHKDPFLYGAADWIPVVGYWG